MSDKLPTPDEYCAMCECTLLNHDKFCATYRALYSRMEAAERVCEAAARYRHEERQEYGDFVKMRIELDKTLAEWEAKK